MLKTEKRNVGWIDCAKFLAIFAVLVDHTKGILYEGETLQYVSFYSVAVFFFLSGMTSYFSLQTRGEGEGFLHWVGRRLGKILVPYLAAVALYQYLKSGFAFSLAHFVLWAVHFNLEGPFYFVLIYLQMLAAAPVLYLITIFCRRGKLTFLWRGLFLSAAWLVSLFCMKHTFALETYGGGNYLFGGTYLFLFVMGMISADMKIGFHSRKNAAAVLAGALVLYAGSLAFLLKDRLAWDESLFGWLLRVNPPGITMIVYSLTVIFLVFALYSFASLWDKPVLNGILRIFSWLGHYTLYVYLYHTAILDYLLVKLPFQDTMSPLKTVVYMAAMIGLPVGGKVLFDWLRAALIKKEALRKAG